MNERFHLIDHPLLEHKLCQLRDQNTGTKEFRFLVSEMTTLLCYEATRDIPLREKEVTTPLGTASCHEIEGKTLAAVAILRSGLGMVDGVMTLVPTAKIGHIGIYRDETTKKPVEYYCKMPTDIASRQVLLLEPMLATGETSSYAAQIIENYRCHDIKLLCLVAHRDAVERILRDHPTVNIYCAALDDEVNERGFLVPGVGDAGERMFGTH